MEDRIRCLVIIYPPLQQEGRCTVQPVTVVYPSRLQLQLQLDRVQGAVAAVRRVCFSLLDAFSSLLCESMKPLRECRSIKSTCAPLSESLRMAIFEEQYFLILVSLRRNLGKKFVT